jgi:hypothetical protein
MCLQFRLLNFSMWPSIVAKKRGHEMTDSAVSIESSVKSTRREPPTEFVVEELFLVEESINQDALGCIRSIVRAVVVEVLIPIAAFVAWFRLR